MNHQKAPSFELHTTKMLLESKKTITDLTAQIHDHKLINSEFNEKLNGLINDKNLLQTELKELETEKNQQILNKTSILQDKNHLSFELKELENELNKSQNAYETKKKELETQISGLKNEGNTINSMKERENKAFEFESKKLEFDIKGMRGKIEGLMDSTRKYEREIEEIKERDIRGMENIKKEAEDFRNFIENVEK